MKNKLITHFHLRNVIIYLRLTINGERAEVYTNSKINPVLWCKCLTLNFDLVNPFPKEFYKDQGYLISLKSLL
jgi:hypothetical protein